jgi:transposase
MFGQKSERRAGPPADALTEDLFGKVPEATAEEIREETSEPVAKPRRRRSPRKPLPADLPRREKKIIDVPDGERICACCGKEKPVIGEDVTEQLEIEPVKVYVKQIVRLRRACPSCKDGVAQAPLPPQPAPRASVGVGFLAWLIVSKYADHLPLCRLERIFARHGVELSRARMCDWLMTVAALLDVLVKAMARNVRTGSLIQADETSIRLQSKEKRGKTETAWVWVYLGDAAAPYTVYDFQKSRGRDGPKAMLAGFEGALQTDAYAAYDAALREGGRDGPGAETIGAERDPSNIQKTVARAGCWSHARRGFIEAEDSGDSRATKVLSPIKELFAVEREWKERRAEAEREGRELSFDTRRDLRQEKSKPVVDALYAWMSDRLEVLPQSPLGKAIGYLQNRRDALALFLDDGRIEIDNNAAERALRPIAVGRKNWLFAGSERGGKAAATFFSVLESARRNGLNPYDYLKDVLERLPAHPINQIDDLLPDCWKPSTPP